MPVKQVLGIAASLMVAGCSVGIDMYPVEGPLSQIRPLPIAKAVAEGITGNSGKLSVTMTGGEKCQGRWSSVAPRYAGTSSGSLLTTYGAAAGFTATQTGIVPGVNRGEAMAVCGGGRTIEVEFYTGSGTASGYGVARDSDGNVYKLLF